MHESAGDLVAIVAVLLIGVIAACVVISVNNDDPSEALFIGILIAAALLGNLVVLPIGGADMPVVIPLLNAFTGLAAAPGGFALDNVAPIVAQLIMLAVAMLLALDAAAHPDDPAAQAALDDLKQALEGKTVGVQVATTHQNFVDEYLADAVEVRRYDTQENLDLDLELDIAAPQEMNDLWAASQSATTRAADVLPNFYPHMGPIPGGLPDGRAAFLGLGRLLEIDPGGDHMAREAASLAGGEVVGLHDPQGEHAMALRHVDAARQRRRTAAPFPQPTRYPNAVLAIVLVSGPLLVARAGRPRTLRV